MPSHFAALLESLSADAHTPGVMLVAQNASIGVAIQSLLEIWACSAHVEWRNLIVFLPL
jgi:hypothetical protein